MKKYSLQTAFKKTLKELNRLAIQIIDSSKELEEIFPNDIAVQEYIKSTFHMVDGNIHGHKESKRYGNIEPVNHFV